MNKYYVRFGSHDVLVLAECAVSACSKAFRKISEKHTLGELPVVFEVSDRGFELHNDNLVVNTSTVLTYMISENEKNWGRT